MTLLKFILPLLIRFIVASPGENASREININWHCDNPGSVLELTFASDTDFSEARTISPQEKLWSYREGDALMQQPRYVCSAELRDLKRARSYIFRIKDGDEVSSVHSFSTASGAQKWQFLCFVDFQHSFNKLSHSVINNTIGIAPKAPLAICSGDMTDYGAKEESLRWLWGPEPFRDLVFAATPGDHEYWGFSNTKKILQMPAPTSYNVLFDNPKNGTESCLNSNYYFYWNNILFVGLDFSDSNTTSCDKFRDEVQWLRDVIKPLKGTYRYLVVLGHKSLYGSYTTDSGVGKYIRPVFAPVFKELGVDMVLGGHDHMYSRTKSIDGTYYLDLGSSGDKARVPDEGLYKDGLHETVIDLKTSGQSLGAVVSVTRKKMSVNVYDLSGEVVDSFEIRSK